MERIVSASKDLSRKAGDITFEKNEKARNFACYPVIRQKETLKNYGDFLDISLEHRNVLELPLGMTVTRDSVEKGRFSAETVFYARAQGKKESTGCQIKKMPEGLYAVMLYDGEIATFGARLSTMLSYIKNCGYIANERFFLFDLINFITYSGKNYAAKIMIGVTKPKN